MKNLVLVLLYCLIFESGFAQTDKVSKVTDSMVDLFTGDFSYGLPLISIPGPNGENFPISINYNGGIQMEQDATMVGLGWTLNTGEIIHQVKGVSDDFKNVNVSKKGYKSSSCYPCSAFSNVHANVANYGPVYFKDFTTPSPPDYSTMDMYQENGLGYGGNTLSFPDYDSYYVSAPGIGGEMNLHMFEFGYLIGKTGVDGISYQNSHQGFSKTPQFTFKDDFSGQLNTPYDLSSTPYNDQISAQAIFLDQNQNGEYHFSYQGANGNIYDYPDACQGSDYSPYQNVLIVEPFTSASTLPTDYSGTGYDQTTNRLKTGKYVKYYTNSELVSGTLPTGFLDYDDRNVTSSQRSGTDYLDLIGAIQITDANGMVYHYSLPVYGYGEESKLFRVKETGGVDQNYDNSINHELTIEQNNHPYVYTYKLTSITGPDYKDLNNNHLADDGDSGYWISLIYGEWTSEYHWCTPFYNYSKLLNKSLLKENESIYSADDLRFYYTGSVSSGYQQLFYLNKIQTATHSAVFYYDARQDGISKRDNQIFPNDPHPNNNPIAQLKLRRIILLKNDDLSNISLGSSMNLDSRFDAGTVNIDDIYKEDDFQSNSTIINNKSLKSIEFIYDYSLCNLVYNNINNSFNKSLTAYQVIPENSGDPTSYNLFQEVTPESCSNVSNRGKLTLKEIKTYQVGGTQTSPSHLFDYSNGGTYDNPNYNPEARDYWGYYKSDKVSGVYTGLGYLTPDNGSFSGSKNNVSAWSLKKITQPSGSKISVDYESDEFKKINYENENGRPSDVTRAFLLQNISYTANFSTNKMTVTFDLPEDFSHLYNSTQCSNINLVLTISGTGVPNESILRSGTNDASDNLTFTHSSNNSYSADIYLDKLVGCSGCTLSTVSIINGFVELNMNYGYGGGVRVGRIKVYDPVQDKTYKTHYTYENGVASHEPDLFSKATNTLHIYLGASDQDCPSPQVGYSKVKIERESDDDQIEGFELDSFQTAFGQKKIGFHDDVAIYDAGIGIVNSLAVLRCYNSSQFGFLNSKFLYDSHGSLLSNENYYYSQKCPITELFFEDFTYTYDNHDYPIKKMNLVTQDQYYLSSIVRYENGLKSITEFSNLNEFTGEPLTIKNSSPLIGYREVNLTPAYLNYSNLGSKVLSESNSNELNRIEKVVTHGGGIDETFVGKRVITNDKTLSGNKKIFSDQMLIRKYNSGTSSWENNSDPDNRWRLKQEYVYNGFVDENNWHSNGEITIFDERGHVLESKSSLGVYNSNKYGYNSTLEISSIHNASYQSCAFTSFEDKDQFGNFGGEVKLNTGNSDIEPTTFSPHTGQMVIKMPSSVTYGPSFSTTKCETGRRYRASVWYYNGSFEPGAALVIQLDGSHGGNGSNPISIFTSKQLNSLENITCGDWTQVNIEIDIPQDYEPMNGPGGLNDLRVFLMNPSGATTDTYFDDLCIKPLDSDMQNLVYDKKTNQVVSTLDNENFATYIEYDAEGRPVESKIETTSGIKKVSKTEYHFVRQ